MDREGRESKKETVVDDEGRDGRGIVRPLEFKRARKTGNFLKKETALFPHNPYLVSSSPNSCIISNISLKESASIESILGFFSFPSHSSLAL